MDGKTYRYPTAFSSWGDEEQVAIAKVCASGRYTMGPETEALEAELAEFCHREHAICVNSGSSANMLALRAMHVTETSHMIDVTHARAPALAWGTTYAPLVQEGFSIRLLDPEIGSWNVPAEEFSTPDNSLIVTCSILGNPAPLDEIEVYAAEYDDVWLNDDCEAMGAVVGGRPTASYGTVATQSFYWSHQLGAIEGGAVLTDDDEIAAACRSLRDHGLTRHDKRPKPFHLEYEFVHHGYNLRPIEMHSAIAREQLKKVALARTARRANWYTFASHVRDLPLRMPTLAEGANPFGVHFLVPPDLRTRLAYALRAAGIDCRPPTGGSYRRHPYGRSLARQHTPIADEIHDCGMFLGNAPYPIEGLVEEATDVIREVLS